MQPITLEEIIKKEKLDLENENYIIFVDRHNSITSFYLPKEYKVEKTTIGGMPYNNYYNNYDLFFILNKTSNIEELDKELKDMRAGLNYFRNDSIRENKLLNVLFLLIIFIIILTLFILYPDFIKAHLDTIFKVIGIAFLGFSLYFLRVGSILRGIFMMALAVGSSFLVSIIP